MLKTKVKVGNISNLSDARYCAGMGVALLGFSIGSGYDDMDTKKYKEITEWVSGPDFVVEWAGADIPDNFAEIIQSYNAGWVEINARDLKNIPPLEVRWIVSVNADDWDGYQEVIRSNRNRIGYVLLTGLGTGPLNHELITKIGTEFPLLLGSGITEKNLDQLSGLPVAGISLEGTQESTVGLKDYSHLSDILERLETPD